MRMLCFRVIKVRPGHYPYHINMGEKNSHARLIHVLSIPPCKMQGMNIAESLD